MFEEEIEAIKSVYFQPGECTVYERTITIKLSLETPASTNYSKDVKVIINVDEDYPRTFPEFSVMSEVIKRESIANLKMKVKDACMDLVGQPMILALVSAVKDHLESVTETETLTFESDEARSTGGISCDLDNNYTALLHIDHMRSRTNYCKTLEKWTKDLDLKGRLLFCKRLILLILQGKYHSIKDFIVRLKTSNVDVDSRGHSCKEKMMSVLAEEACQASTISDYQVLELSDISEVKKVFTESGLKDMYMKYVSNMKG